MFSIQSLRFYYVNNVIKYRDPRVCGGASWLCDGAAQLAYQYGNGQCRQCYGILPSVSIFGAYRTPRAPYREWTVNTGGYLSDPDPRVIIVRTAL